MNKIKAQVWDQVIKRVESMMDEAWLKDLYRRVNDLGEKEALDELIAAFREAWKERDEARADAARLRKWTDEHHMEYYGAVVDEKYQHLLAVCEAAEKHLKVACLSTMFVKSWDTVENLRRALDADTRHLMDTIPYYARDEE